jgi:hypothetical protein
MPHQARRLPQRQAAAHTGRQLLKCCKDQSFKKAMMLHLLLYSHTDPNCCSCIMPRPSDQGQPCAQECSTSAWAVDITGAVLTRINTQTQTGQPAPACFTNPGFEQTQNLNTLLYTTKLRGTVPAAQH